MQIEGNQGKVWNAKVDSSGRVLLPAELRHAMHVHPDTTLQWIMDDNGLHLKSFEESLSEIQNYFRSLSPAEEIWSEELIAERRSESERD